MKHVFRTTAVFLGAILSIACASQEPTGNCTLTAAELAQIKSDALTYLLEEAPALDARCEQITNQVTSVDPGMCAIAGGPSHAAGCGEPSHAGFSIVFDRESLEPKEIYFKSE